MIHEAWYSLGLAERPKYARAESGESAINKSQVKSSPSHQKEESKNNGKDYRYSKDWTYTVGNWCGYLFMATIVGSIIGFVIYAIFKYTSI